MSKADGEKKYCKKEKGKGVYIKIIWILKSRAVVTVALRRGAGKLRFPSTAISPTAVYKKV